MNKDIKVKIEGNYKLWNYISQLNSIYEKYRFNDICGEMICRYEKRTSGQKFSNIENFEFDEECLERKSSHFNYAKYLITQILEDKEKFKVVIDKYIAIFNVYTEYLKKAKKLLDIAGFYREFKEPPKKQRSKLAQFFVSDRELHSRAYSEFYEAKLYEEKVLKSKLFAPKFPYVILKLSALTPFDYYCEDQIYDFDAIVKCYNWALQKEGKMTFIEQQRKIMTDDIRYEVLKKDNFRCCICGATAKDGVKLEVDHIIPVSKGGKTTIDNLQTLCERCNRGKRDKI